MKRGRPAKPPGDVLQKWLTIRASVDDVRRLAQLATAWGITQSDATRRMISEAHRVLFTDGDEK